MQERFPLIIGALVLAVIGTLALVVVGSRRAPVPNTVVAEVVEEPQTFAGGGFTSGSSLGGGSSFSGGDVSPASFELPAPSIVEEVVEAMESDEPMEVRRGAVRIRVIEETTRQPLDRVTVELFSVSGGDPLVAQTNASGNAIFHNMSEGDWDVELQWGVRTRHEAGGFTLEGTDGGEWTFTYPGRQPFPFRLFEEDGSPASFVELEVGVQVHAWQTPQSVKYEKVRTDAQGHFEVLGFPNARPVVIRSEGAEMFTSVDPNRENRRRGGNQGGWGSGWANPHIHPQPLRENQEDPTSIWRRTGQVRATGILVNAPNTSPDNPWVATVQAGGGLNLAIEVQNDRFSFATEPGAEARVVLSRSSSAGWNVRNRSFEKVHEVTIPETPGEFEFEIPFEDRMMITGRVEQSDGTPISGVRVVATGYAAQEEGDQTNRRGGGGGGNWLTGGANARLMADASDRSGNFSIELPPAATWSFEPQFESMPDDYKTVELVRTRNAENAQSEVQLSWERIAEGEEITFVLGLSTLFWGEVIDEDGRPVAGARVTLGDQSENAPAIGGGGRGGWGGNNEAVVFTGPAGSTLTDENGVFELNTPRIELEREIAATGGDLYLVAQRRGSYGVARATPDSASPTLIRIYEPASGHFEVTMNGEPVPRVEISSFYDGEGLDRLLMRRDLRIFQNDEGIYAFRNVPRDVTWFTFSLPGAPISQSVVIQIPPDAGGEEVLRVDLTPPEE